MENELSFTDNDLRRQLILLKEIESQSDRGTAIVGAAWLEEELKATLKSRFLEDEQVSRRLFSNGALSEFSTCLDLAYMLKVITKEQYKDLDKIRKIRNDFAHKLISKQFEELSFDNANIRDRCMTFSCIIKEEDRVTSRHAFCRACAILYADIYLSAFMPEGCFESKG